MDLTNYVPTPLSAMKDRFAEAKFNTSLLVKAALETVEEVTGGQAVLMDATNPMVLQLEMAAALTAGCVQENIGVLRKQYAVLAQTEDDLYMHMSDDDYVDRFSSPSLPAMFTVCVLTRDLVREAIYDSVENVSKLVIPRDTEITVDGVTFTTLYPVVIRYYDNQTISVSYDTTVANPVYPLKTSLIDTKIRTGTDNETWLFFNVSALQVKVSPEFTTIDKTYSFEKTIDLVDSFYYARVFYKNNATGNLWVEMATTHTDQVFNIKKPTAVLKVTETQLEVRIPVIYTTSGLISGEVRVDVYTTKGELSLNLANFTADAFTMKLKAIDEDSDLSVYTEAMSSVSFYAYSIDYVTGGKAAVSFETLLDQVIHNATGANDIPITTVQLEADEKQNGFTIVKGVDVLTNRIFLATKKLPVPTQKKLITAANIGMITYAADEIELADHYKVVKNGNRSTILSKAVWLNVNGQVSLLSKSDYDALYGMGQTAMVAALNATQYFYTPFYYVLDATGDEFEVRSYALDQPYAKDQNFVRVNQTLQLPVYTSSYILEKNAAGYALTIVTASDNFYKALPDSNVGVQLAYFPYGEKIHAYINGELMGLDEGGNRIYKFQLNTNHDVSLVDTICITNSSIEGITNFQGWVPLETEVKLIHYTTSITNNYVADETDKILGKFLLPNAAVGNTLETLTIHLGDSLDNLWRRSRSFMTDIVYELCDADIPRVYQEDEFEYDASGRPFKVVNGELVFNYLHRKGDIVLNANGDTDYKYRKGDVLMDAQGNPITKSSVLVGRTLDLLVVDGRYYFADDTATVAYRKEVEALLTDWIVNDLAVIENRLLDLTDIYFYPETSVGEVEVEIENGEKVFIRADQEFNLSLYVTASVFENEDIRAKLNSATVSLLDTAMSGQTVNMTEISESLKKLYATTVSAFTISGLGGSANYQFLKVSEAQNRLCLKKRLAIQADKTMMVEDAVTVEYKLIK